MTPRAAAALSPAELHGLVLAKQREYRRWLSVISWSLSQLEWLLIRAVAKGISIGFGDKKQPVLTKAKEFFDRAPRFDWTVREETDDGR